MTDFAYGRWYKDGDNKIWRMESRVESVGDHRVFVVSSFESWYGRNIPRNIAVINNDNPNIGVIQLEEGTVTINAEEPVSDDIVQDALVLVMAGDLKKSIDRWVKKG